MCVKSDEIISLYRELKLVKKLTNSEVLSDNYIKNIFDLYSDKLLVLKISNREGTCISARGVIINQNYAFDIFAASNAEGRATGSSYVLIFELLKKLDEIEPIELFDLNGVDPVNNKGVFDFKSGLGGDVVFRQGQYIRSNSKLGDFILSLFGGLL